MSKAGDIDPSAAKAYAQECARRAAIRNKAYRDRPENQVNVQTNIAQQAPMGDMEIARRLAFALAKADIQQRDISPATFQNEAAKPVIVHLDMPAAAALETNESLIAKKLLNQPMSESEIQALDDLAEDRLQQRQIDAECLKQLSKNQPRFRVISGRQR